MKRSISEITKELAQVHGEHARLTSKKTSLYKKVIELKKELTRAMNVDELLHIRNPNGRFWFTHNTKPTVVDHAALQKYIYENNALDLLHMHPNKEVEKRIEETGEQIPGIEVIEYRTLNVKGEE